MSCITCKGRGRCGRSLCPHIMKASSMFKAKELHNETEFASVSPAPFVGRAGYPYVNVGLLAPPENTPDAWLYDAPRHWGEHSFSIQQVVDYRSALLNSRFRADIKGQSRMLDISKEVGLAKRPAELEFSIKAKPKFHLQKDTVTAPTGPRANLEKVRFTSNPKVHTKVDKVNSDTDMLAADALNYLYKNEFDENFLSRALSVGSFGIGPNRKLVPTRWSITAVDDTLGKNIYSKIIEKPAVNDFQAYYDGFMGNYYLFLMMPDIWSYELFETYMPNASWNQTRDISYSTDYEGYHGRKRYADNCAGGYYSVRLALLEKLKAMKRQSATIVIRIITGEYTVPLGVWVTREASRKALSSDPIRFSSVELILKYAKALCRKKFGLDADLLLDNSQIMKEKKQTKLTAW
jgi:hypothetical protein